MDGHHFSIDLEGPYFRLFFNVVLWAEIPPYSEGFWKRCRPRAYPKLPEGRRLRSSRGPRAVLDMPEDGIFSRSQGKRWNFNIIN